MPVTALARQARTVVAAHPVAYWVAVATLAGLAFVSVHGTVRRAEGTRAAWGTTREVVVATRDLAAGDTVHAASTAIRALPIALVPDDALVHVPDDAVAAAPIAAGEPVLARRLVGGGSPPPGTRAVAVPLDLGAPPLPPGATVDLAGAGGVVARHAVVVTAGADTVVVAVAAEELAAVASALTAGPLVVALAP